MKSQSGIRYGQKKQSGQSDTHQLISIKSYLKKRWHLDFKREWYVGFDPVSLNIVAILDKVPKGTQIKWKNPDLIHIGKHGVIIIEVDGAVHDRKMLDTWKRNELYKINGVKLVVLNLAEIKASGKTIYEKLDCDLDKILGGTCAKH